MNERKKMVNLIGCPHVQERYFTRNLNWQDICGILSWHSRCTQDSFYYDPWAKRQTWRWEVPAEDTGSPTVRGDAGTHWKTRPIALSHTWKLWHTCKVRQHASHKKRRHTHTHKCLPRMYKTDGTLIKSFNMCMVLCFSRSCCPHLCLHLACYTTSSSGRRQQHFHKCFTLMVAGKEHVSDTVESFALIQLKWSQSNSTSGLQTSWLIIWII